ncbi:Amidase [Quillaja saponaria]|uniref:Amidase n=1 Tax=Quillaja saponaria TaxID=32244 RepID=A0AAD7QC55_QUISA|nr:Amidase [Quillaja saponaria]
MEEVDLRWVKGKNPSNAVKDRYGDWMLVRRGRGLSRLKGTAEIGETSKEGTPRRENQAYHSFFWGNLSTGSRFEALRDQINWSVEETVKEVNHQINWSLEKNSEGGKHDGLKQKPLDTEMRVEGHSQHVVRGSDEYQDKEESIEEMTVGDDHYKQRGAILVDNLKLDNITEIYSNTEKVVLANLATLTNSGFVKLITKNKQDALVTPGDIKARILAIRGFPGISVPAGYTKDGPLGICFGGLKGSEPKLIKIAYGFEKLMRDNRLDVLVAPFASVASVHCIGGIPGINRL